jgi:hypothetical protein
VVDADALARDFREFATVRGAKICVVEGARDRLFFFLRAVVGGRSC